MPEKLFATSDEYLDAAENFLATANRVRKSDPTDEQRYVNRANAYAQVAAAKARVEANKRKVAEAMTAISNSPEWDKPSATAQPCGLPCNCTTIPAKDNTAPTP